MGYFRILFYVLYTYQNTKANLNTFYMAITEILASESLRDDLHKHIYAYLYAHYAYITCVRGHFCVGTAGAWVGINICVVYIYNIYIDL